MLNFLKFFSLMSILNFMLSEFSMKTFITLGPDQRLHYLPFHLIHFDAGTAL